MSERDIKKKIDESSSILRVLFVRDMFIVTWALLLIVIFLMIYLVFDVKKANAQSITAMSPNVMVMDSRAGTDFWAGMNFFDVRDLVVDRFKLEWGYQRSGGEYFVNNDYRLGFRGVFLRDIRRDGSGIHIQECGYMTDRLPYIKVGWTALVDKSNAYYGLGVTECDIKFLRFRYYRNMHKTIYEGELDISKPLKQWWRVHYYLLISGSYIYDTDYRESKMVRVGMMLRIK